jgi:hypothetical protein
MTESAFDRKLFLKNGRLTERSFYIFIWGTAPGGDEDIWAIKLYFVRVQIP